MRKIILGTPSYDGRVDVAYVNSLLSTVQTAIASNWQMQVVFASYDALVQRARNELIAMSLELGVDELIFADADLEWKPEWITRLLSHPVDVVGLPVRRRTDAEGYNVWIPNYLEGIKIANGLISVEAVGTGLMRLSRRAVQMLWNDAPMYMQNGAERRMVFDVKVANGILVSEDYTMCQNWRRLGGDVWVDPSVTCAHIGTKRFDGDFSKLVSALQTRAQSAARPA